MPVDSEVQHTATAYRVSGLSFCPLEDRVIVLDPNQGLYFQLSKRLSSFLQSLPETPSEIAPSATEGRLFSAKERSFLKALANSKLLTPQSKLSPEQAAKQGMRHQSQLRSASSSGDIGYTDEIELWGTLSELTQVPPPPSGGTTVGGPPI